jgi:hypothetical protein
MIDKHAQATTFRSEEVAKETVNEPSLEYPTLFFFERNYSDEFHKWIIDIAIALSIKNL